MYDSYKRKTGATQPSNYTANCEASSQVAIDFFSQPGYAEIYKNNISSTFYDVIIMDGDKEDKTVGYKKLLSYPYDTVRFSIGDYIYWDFGGEDTIWILTSLDKQFTYEVNGKIYKCNTTLKWKNTNGVTISYPVSLEAFKFSSESTAKEVNNRLIIGDGKRYVTMQRNSDTLQLKRNNRFIFDDRAWKIVDLDTTHELVQLSLEEHQVNTSTDDLVNEIADAFIDTTVVPSSPTSGITGDFTLPIGQTGEYSIIGSTGSDNYTFSLSNSNGSIISSTARTVKVKAGSVVGNTFVLSAQHTVSLVIYTATITVSALW